MRIFFYKCDSDRFASLDWDSSLFELSGDFQKKPIGKTWVPQEVSVYKLKRMTMPDLLAIRHSVPVFTREAKELLSGSMSNTFEYLPLICPGLDLFAINVLGPTDALVENASDIRKNKFGRIMDIYDGVFQEKLVRNLGFFTIANNANVYITELLLDTINYHGLKGLRIKEAGIAK